MEFSNKFICFSNEKCELNKNIPSPYFRKTFFISKKIISAEFTICGLGFYKLFLNGKEITKGFLSPYISNSNDILDYDFYDLSNKIGVGDNVLAFQLGNGMQNAFGGYVWDFDKAEFRSSPCFAAILKLTYYDGSVEKIETDNTFKCSYSPILKDDLRLGEIFDANKIIKNWNKITFDDSLWKKAIYAKVPKGKTTLCIANPIKERTRLYPVKIFEGVWVPGNTKIKHNGYIFDFGLNTSGICKLKISGRSGQKITMTFGEILNNGEFYTDNISFIRPVYKDFPDYVQQDIYICNNKKNQIYKPSFTYHGFRYVFVEGISKEQATKELLTYIVMNTKLDKKGDFICSDEKLNRLKKMTDNSTLSNFYHFPTDCPHREKNGWTADAALSCEHTLLNFNASNNYIEWIKHIVKAQNEDGALPGIIPTSGWGFSWENGPAWDQVIVEIPFMLYKYNGNIEIIKESIDAIYKYIRYLNTRKNDNGLIEIGLGDWCAPNGIKSPLIFTDSVICMDICFKSALLAKQVNNNSYYNYFNNEAKEYKKNIRKYLIDNDTKNVIGSCQTSQAMALYYNLFTEEEKNQAYNLLLKYIYDENNHLDRGVLGARTIFRVLCNFNDSELAYKTIVEPTPPSYGYWLECGNTALAEDISVGQIEACSKNHHFWGDISALFIKYFCGINYNPTSENLYYTEIKPNIPESLDFAKAYHITNFGKISVEWTKNCKVLTSKIIIPNVINYKIDFSKEWKESERHVSIKNKYTYIIIKFVKGNINE